VYEQKSAVPAYHRTITIKYGKSKRIRSLSQISTNRATYSRFTNRSLSLFTQSSFVFPGFRLPQTSGLNLIVVVVALFGEL